MEYITPIVMPRGTHYGSNYWEAFSIKLKRKVCLFSNLEYENFLCLELNPKVLKYCEQPLQIEINEDNKIYKSVLDFWVKYSDDTEEFQEVKYSSELIGSDKASLRSQEQIRRQKIWCNLNGIKYSVRTETEINKGEFTIRNYNFMHSKIRRLSTLYPEKYKSILVDLLNTSKSIRIKNIVASNILSASNELAILCYFYYLGIINMNLDIRPIDNLTEVSLCQ